MAETKTKPTTQSVTEFVANVADPTTRKDCATLVKMMRRITGAPAKMWGPSIVGFGTYHYVYASGQTGDWPLAAFSPRKQNLTVYVMGTFKRREALMKKLGRCKTAKVCLYMKTLADIDLSVLEDLLTESVAYMRKLYPAVGAAAAARSTKQAAAAKPIAKPAAAKKKATTKRAKR